ncbi:hypothetical protein O1L55_09705 [Streptomyces albulus]|nr:hypothetical protein [Streptomyces noursei]
MEGGVRAEDAAAGEHRCAWSVLSRLTPPTTAASISPVRSPWTAMPMATSADEQAVSTTTLGPRKSKNCEMLAAR